MSANYKSYEALLETIYTAGADPSRWSAAITHSADYLGAIGGALGYCAPEGQKSFNILGRISNELDDLFWQYYVKNPWTISMVSAPIGTPIACSSRVERQVLRRTAFYADCVKPLGAEELITASLRIRGMAAGVARFSFHLSERGMERSAESLRRLNRILPHLSRALDTSVQLGRYADGTRQLPRALELMPTPALLLNAARRITYANAPAEALLRLNDGLSTTPGGNMHLTTAFPAETVALERAISAALLIATETDSAPQWPLRLTRPSGRASLLVLPVSLPPPALAMWELVEAARAMVLVIDPESQALNMADSVQGTFELTAAESRVAALIGGGLSGPQTAVALGISRETVKTHLARCFEKTGVHSQAGLARLIAMIPRRPAGSGLHG